ncbi:hypothetical protein COLO4_07192 [Corchorus olitorius]|uniref:Uncharacterized protein n=1 Tax=Corchorus olitorius TaxID=93759 RepID=A0A1R3KKJ8_9ROSI|nr:hypothetical protein COLO4_07192 [Corchorus olitorius]
MSFATLPCGPLTPSSSNPSTTSSTSIASIGSSTPMNDDSHRLEMGGIGGSGNGALDAAKCIHKGKKS